MSWIEQLKSKLTIITGDGKRYEPQWKDAKVIVGYNVTEFNFPNVKGTYVDKREQIGSKFSLELYFQGDDHLDIMKEFVRSAEDKRPWTILHPFYDVLNVQPEGLSIDNSDYNVSKITITATQTIERVQPVTTIIPADKIDEDVELINEVIVKQLTSPDASLLLSQVNDFSVKTTPKIENDIDGQEFINKTSLAKEGIANISTNRVDAIQYVQNLLLAPAKFNQSVKSRLNMISSNFDYLTNQITGTVTAIKNLPNDFKNTFEAFGASLLASLCSIMSLPLDSDYGTREDVNNSIESLLNMYNSYISSLDSMEIGTGGNPQDYQPNAETIIYLNNLVSFTVSNLFTIAKDAKQERSVILTEDSDFITLAHRFYGLKQTDETIDELILNNNLGLNGILNIKKGTEITYYI